MKTINLLYVLCLSIVISGCQQTTDFNQLPRELKIHTTVSNTSGNFHPSKSDNFHWLEPIQLYPASLEHVNSQIPLITHELNQQLQHKGYQLSNMAQASRFYLRGAIVYGNELHDKKLQQIFGIEPGLGSDDDNYPRGSLLLAITKPSGLTVWRGAMQIFAEPTLADEIKKQRISLAIASMLSNLPNIEAD
ncbi:MAG: hypothetical protein ACJA0N_001336 [Pseudohongiellaceae bacterium]|jgi:hypothetical protein